MPASQTKLSKQTRKHGVAGVTHVAIIGAGRGGTALLEIFANDPLVDIVAVAEIDASAPGLALAKRFKIPVTRDYRMLLNLERVDLIIDVSGSPDVWQSLQDFHRMGVTILGGASAKFMWELIEARIRATAEIEKTLNKYQSLYRLYVKETGAAVTEERTRIACEIHDGLVQSLAGVGFKLELSQQLIRKDPKASLATLRESKEQLKHAIHEARQVIFSVEEILPVVVKKDGRREMFDRSKILSGLKKACEKRPISTATIEAVADRIEKTHSGNGRDRD